MLELREYTRNELLQIYNTTTRLDAIKNKVKRQGYTFVDVGRGKDYKMLITGQPPSADRFKQYCIETLNFQPQTDFKVLRQFIFNLLNDDGFINLQFREMAEVMKGQGVETTEQTASKYFHHLAQLGLIHIFGEEYIYFVFDYTQSKNRYISREEYTLFYSAFWQIVSSDGEDLFSAFEITQKYGGGKPKKKRKAVLNGIYNDWFSSLYELTKESFYNDKF